MNPAMIQAIAADRSRDMQEQATAWRRTGEGRRRWLARPPRPLTRIPLARRAPGFRSAS